MTDAVTGKRSDLAQQGPPADGVAGFPAVAAGVLPLVWHREHGDRPGQPDRGCWWFASHEPGVEPGGRFDLLAPHGTCYLGETVGVAVRERCGRFIAGHMPIPVGHMTGRVVSTVELATAPVPVADLTSPDGARFGVTGELASRVGYETSAEWAEAFFDDGFVAVLYHPRYTPGQERALALFDVAAASGDRVVETVPLVDAVTASGYRVSRSTVPSTPAVDADDTAEPEDA